MPVLGDQDLLRFDRQMRLWGERGQERLKAASVGVVGVGGLGSAAATYLAAAGVGKLVLVDKDTVEASNLNRQILHTQADLGRLKVDSAADRLRLLYPGIQVVALSQNLDAHSVERMLAGVDGLVDGLDNFPTRFLLNAYAVSHRLPLFHGAVWGWEGRVATVVPGRTPCLRCLYPQVPAEGETFPVVGVAPGLIGVIQATEAIKYFLQTGTLLLDRLLIYDGEALEFTQVPTERDSRCPVCGGL